MDMQERAGIVWAGTCVHELDGKKVEILSRGLCVGGVATRDNRLCPALVSFTGLGPHGRVVLRSLRGVRQRRLTLCDIHR